jgi:hypothetical protein
MTTDDQRDEGAEEQVEDLEAPAETQGDVAGGAGDVCAAPTEYCVPGTCVDTVSRCIRLSLQKEKHLA